MELYSRKHGTHSSDLIILHGLFGMSDNWNTLGKKFADSFTVHLIDLRNHGKSPHSTEFNLEVMSQDLLNYINNNNIKEPIILGHSLGGKVAMKFAFLYPDKLRKLIVVDISPRRYDMNFHMKILSTIYRIPLEECNRREDVEDMLSTTIKDKGTRLFLLKNLYRDSNNKFTWKINVEVLLDSLSLKKNFKAFSSSHSYIFLNQSLWGFSSSDFINEVELLKFKFEFLQNKQLISSNLWFSSNSTFSGLIIPH